MNLGFTSSSEKPGWTAVKTCSSAHGQSLTYLTLPYLWGGQALTPAQR